MINKVLIIGNMGKDPEVRYTSGGMAVCTLSVATNRSWVDKASGQKKDEVEWHTVEVFGKQAEACGEYLAKGRQVFVEGRLKTDKWQDKQTGQDKYRTKIVAEQVRFLGGKGEGGPRRDRTPDEGGGRRHDDPVDGGGGGDPGPGGGMDDSSIPF